MNVGNSFNVLPLGISEVGFGLEFLKFSLGLFEDLLHTFLEQLDLDLWDVDNLNVVEDLLACEAVDDDGHEDHTAHVKGSQLSESHWVVWVDGDHHCQ
jgi:hypothetical protein